MAYDEDLADRIRDLLSQQRGVTEKKMFGGLAFLLHGNMSVSASRSHSPNPTPATSPSAAARGACFAPPSSTTAPMTTAAATVIKSRRAPRYG